MNDQQRAAMQMALEALEKFGIEVGANGKVGESIIALREALEASSGGSESSSGGMAQPQDHSVEATDMVQGEWVDLTDDEILAIAIQYDAEEGISDVEYGNRVLKAFKEKNTPPIVPQGELVAWMHTFMGVAQINTTPPEVYGKDWTHQPLYTTPPSVEVMRLETLEKAAKVCESYINCSGNYYAAAIRSMK